MWNLFKLVKYVGWNQYPMDHLTILGRNVPHCFKFLHYMGEIPLNLNPNDPLALVKKLSRFNDLIELDMLMENDLNLCLHDLV